MFKIIWNWLFPSKEKKTAEESYSEALDHSTKTYLNYVKDEKEKEKFYHAEAKKIITPKSTTVYPPRPSAPAPRKRHIIADVKPVQTRLETHRKKVEEKKVERRTSSHRVDNRTDVYVAPVTIPSYSYSAPEPSYTPSYSAPDSSPSYGGGDCSGGGASMDV